MTDLAQIMLAKMSDAYLHQNICRFYPNQFNDPESAELVLGELESKGVVQRRAWVRIEGADVWYGPVDELPSRPVLAELYEAECGEELDEDDQVSVAVLFEATDAFKTMASLKKKLTQQAS